MYIARAVPASYYWGWMFCRCKVTKKKRNRHVFGAENAAYMINWPKIMMNSWCMGKKSIVFLAESEDFHESH